MRTGFFYLSVLLSLATASLANEDKQHVLSSFHDGDVSLKGLSTSCFPTTEQSTGGSNDDLMRVNEARAVVETCTSPKRVELIVSAITCEAWNVLATDPRVAIRAPYGGECRVYPRDCATCRYRCIPCPAFGDLLECNFLLNLSKLRKTDFKSMK
jgi:hypothetical protein